MPPAVSAAGRAANRSPWYTRTRSCTPTPTAFLRASATQSSVRSAASTRRRGSPAARAQARFPEPQHISMTRSVPSAPGGMLASACSAVRPRSSVSGRGTSAPGATQSSTPKKDTRPSRRALSTSSRGSSSDPPGLTVARGSTSGPALMTDPSFGSCPSSSWEDRSPRLRTWAP